MSNNSRFVFIRMFMNFQGEYCIQSGIRKTEASVNSLSKNGKMIFRQKSSKPEELEKEIRNKILNSKHFDLFEGRKKYSCHTQSKKRIESKVNKIVHKAMAACC